MLYVDTGGLDCCYPGGNPSREAAKAVCKLQLYGEKIPVLSPTMYQIPGAQFKYQRVNCLGEENDLFQ